MCSCAQCNQRAHLRGERRAYARGEGASAATRPSGARGTRRCISGQMSWLLCVPHSPTTSSAFVLGLCAHLRHPTAAKNALRLLSRCRSSSTSLTTLFAHTRWTELSCQLLHQFDNVKSNELSNSHTSTCSVYFTHTRNSFPMLKWKSLSSVSYNSKSSSINFYITINLEVVFKWVIREKFAKIFFNFWYFVIITVELSFYFNRYLSHSLVIYKIWN